MLPRVPQAAAEEGLLFGVPAKGVGAVVRPGHLGRVAAVVDAGRAHDPEQHAEGVEVAVEGVGPVEEDLRRRPAGGARRGAEAPRGVGREDVQAPKAKVQELRVATGVEAHVVVLQVAQQRPHARVEVLEPQEDLRKERLCRGLGHDALRAGGCKVLHRRAKIDTHRGAWAGAIIHRDEEQRLCGQVHDIVDAHYAWVGPLPDALGDLALTCRRAAPLHESLHRKARPPATLLWVLPAPGAVDLAVGAPAHVCLGRRRSPSVEASAVPLRATLLAEPLAREAVARLQVLQPHGADGPGRRRARSCACRGSEAEAGVRAAPPQARLARAARADRLLRQGGQGAVQEAGQQAGALAQDEGAEARRALRTEAPHAHSLHRPSTRLVGRRRQQRRRRR
mmetsp:Transcript_85756/g.227903  ORF Transcript_85756/g.227903 Transcript_85756/m.227903 type:complete len:394 (-) Transcript_85756:1922-3103(-)